MDTINSTSLVFLESVSFYGWLTHLLDDGLGSIRFVTSILLRIECRWFHTDCSLIIQMFPVCVLEVYVKYSYNFTFIFLYNFIERLLACLRRSRPELDLLPVLVLYTTELLAFSRRFLTKRLLVHRLVIAACFSYSIISMSVVSVLYNIITLCL